MSLVIVSVVWGDQIIKVDLNTKRKTSHLKQILVKEHGLDRSYRLLFKGQELEEKPLNEQGVEDKSEITVFKPQGFETSGERKNMQELDYMPQPLEDLQNHLLQNPEIMQQMMNSPAMQSLLNDFSFLESIMKMNPATRLSLETNPAFAEMMRDIPFREQACDAFRNPSTMREILQSTDKAVNELKSVPGGIDMITGMYSQLDFDDEDKKPSADDDEADEDGSEQTGPPSWHTACDANAMASMMQDPNLQTLIARYMEATERGVECFSKPEFIASLFRPSNMQAIASMEQAVNAMSTAKAAAVQRGMENLPKNTPAAHFSTTFETFLEAQKENPETKFRTQLRALRNQGFTNTDECIRHLEATGGNLKETTERLLKRA